MGRGANRTLTGAAARGGAAPDALQGRTNIDPLFQDGGQYLDLSAYVARDKPPEWLYYVTRKGVRMTGMPAWEYRLSDRSLWSLVAFLETIPALDKAGYRDVAAASERLECERQSTVPEPSLSAEVLLRQYGCHTCHRIDGVIGPDVDTGPPLIDWRTARDIAVTMSRDERPWASATNPIPQASSSRSRCTTSSSRISA